MQSSQLATEYKVLIINSSAFEKNGTIPRKYTCEGEDVNPPIGIGELPKDARSLVLIVEDPDAPSGNWLHWLVYNIPVTHHINENEVPGDQGTNDFGRNSYGGPCPPSGLHHYHFKVYALDDVIDLPEGSSRQEVESSMRDHILAFGEIVGTYKKLGTRKHD